MDPLSSIIDVLKPASAFWHVVEARGDWTLRFQPENRVIFGQILTGTARVTLAGGSGFDVAKGDFLLLLNPPDWRMVLGSGRREIDFKAAYLDPARLMQGPPDGPHTRFIAANFRVAPATSALLPLILQPVVCIPAAKVADTLLAALLSALGNEVGADRPAGNLVVARLLELILIEALRLDDPSLAPANPGVVAGLRDSRIALALRLIHQDVRQPWTVASLARAAGMSRSAFAQRFAECVGLTPIDYVSRWRIILAKEALSRPDLPMARIADMIGFQSLSAFSTAFKRETGTRPSDFRAAGGGDHR